MRSTLLSLASIKKKAPPLCEKFETPLSHAADNKAWARLSALIYMQAESDLPRVCLAWLSRASETLTSLQRAFPRSTDLLQLSASALHGRMATLIYKQLNVLWSGPRRFHTAPVCKLHRDKGILQHCQGSASGEHVALKQPSGRASSATKAAVS